MNDSNIELFECFHKIGAIVRNGSYNFVMCQTELIMYYIDELRYSITRV